MHWPLPKVLCFFPSHSGEDQKQKQKKKNNRKIKGPTGNLLLPFKYFYVGNSLILPSCLTENKYWKLI